MLAQDLATGSRGVRFQLPPHWELTADAPGVLQAGDRELGILWQVAAVPWRIDAHPLHDALVAADLERDTKAAFERTFKELLAERGPPTNPLDVAEPRTATGDWSPLVEWHRVQVGAASTLCFVFRATYMPGNEHLIGRIQIPCPTGVVQFTAHAPADETGYREAALTMLAESLGEPVTQRTFDDPKHDETFSQHPLSRVRQALGWVLQRLEIAPTDLSSPTAPVELPEADSIVTAPPRYARLPVGTLPMAPTIANFTRVGFDAGEIPRMAEVYHLDHARLRPDDRDGLQRLADETTRSWESEGVERLSWKSSWGRDRNGRIELALRVKFRTPTPVHVAQFWTVDRDGAVFRLSCSGPRTIEFRELAQDAEILAHTWRRRSG